MLALNISESIYCVCVLLKNMRFSTFTIILPVVERFFRNLLAYVHSAIFLYSHWITLVLVVVCCIEGGSIFAFAYLITVFALLWKGTELYATQPFHRFTASWNHLVYYNLVVLAIKALYLVSVLFLMNRKLFALNIDEYFWIVILGKALPIVFFFFAFNVQKIWSGSCFASIEQYVMEINIWEWM